MEGIIKKLYDDSDKIVFPVTSEKAIYMESGKTLKEDLDGRLATINSELNEKTNYDYGQNKIVFGQEYLSAFHRTLRYTSNSSTVIGTGDSTMAGDSAGIEKIDYLIRSYANRDGIGDRINVINAGHSGKNSLDWINTYLAQDMSLNPKLYIIRWGINDRTADTTNFENQMRQGLTTFRASFPLNVCSVVLMTPSTTYYTDDASRIWNEKINIILRKLAREFQCVFIDTFQYLIDSKNGADYMDTPYVDKPTEHIHPNGIMNIWITDLIYKIIFPSSLLNLLKKGVMTSNINLIGNTVDNKSVGEVEIKGGKYPIRYYTIGKNKVDSSNYILDNGISLTNGIDLSHLESVKQYTVYCPNATRVKVATTSGASAGNTLASIDANTLTFTYDVTQAWKLFIWGTTREIAKATCYEGANVFAEYEPFKYHYKELLLDAPLSNMGGSLYSEVKNNQFFNNVGTLILDGSSSTGISLTDTSKANTVQYTITLVQSTLKSGGEIKSDRFQTVAYADRNIDQEGVCVSATNILLRVDRLKLNSGQTVTDLMNWLVNNHTSFYYQLAVPTSTKIENANIMLYSDIKLTNAVKPSISYSVANKDNAIQFLYDEIEALRKKVGY